MRRCEGSGRSENELVCVIVLNFNLFGFVKFSLNSP